MSEDADDTEEGPELAIIKVALGNSEMCTPQHVADMLRKVASRLEDRGDWSTFKISDVNGNTVGKFYTE